ncbi:hypothetical protein GJ496_008009 [Pomphorhynchus laevis]|nr:hypothetical protein GJ496_008009 [Pomphorhynchus laevis]
MVKMISSNSNQRLQEITKDNDRKRQLEKLRQRGIFPFVLFVNLRQWFDPELIGDKINISRFMRMLLKRQIKLLVVNAIGESDYRRSRYPQ